MSLHIKSIGTAVPPFRFTQQDAAVIDQFMGYETDARRQFMRKIYSHVGVTTRHSVVLESSEGPLEQRQTFFPPSSSPTDLGPTTAQRNRFYERAAPELAYQAGRRAIDNAGLSPATITHLVTASCTGFTAPGVDIQLIERLGLSPGTARTHIGFMGCHAAMNALRVTRAFAESDKNAVVLMVAVELCSLHHQYGWSPDRIVSNALFADGAAALVGTGTAGMNRSVTDRSWQLARSGSLLLRDSAADMSWQVGDHGFEMTLSRQVPDIIRGQLRPWVEGWLDESQFRLEDIRSWALSQFGNMSSPTVLFVMERLQSQDAPLPCVAMAFGPGLTLEAALFV